MKLMMYVYGNFRTMRIVLSLFLVFCTLRSLAQDADFNDYRKKTESFSRIYDKGIRSDLASFTIGGIQESLGQTPLKRIPAVQYGPDFINYDSGDIKITIRTGIFNAGKHKLYYEAKHLVKIDNKPYYGNYGKVPGTNIAGILVLAGKDTVQIPASAYGDLYNPGLTYRDASGNVSSQDAVYLSNDKRNIYIYMLNRDDTGSYEVTWIIQDKKYLKRVIDYGFSQ